MKFSCGHPNVKSHVRMFLFDLGTHILYSLFWTHVVVA